MSLHKLFCRSKLAWYVFTYSENCEHLNDLNDNKLTKILNLTKIQTTFLSLNWVKY